MTILLRPAVVIPAHNESSVIGQNLRRLTLGVIPGEFDLVVACNGCTDDTVEKARQAAPWATVLDLPDPGKSAAIVQAERYLGPGPRIYLDADVEVNADALRGVFAALMAGSPGARPSTRFDTEGANFFVRRFFAARARIPHLNDDLSGGGCYGLSWDARARFDQFPDVIADDLFAARIVGSEAVIVRNSEATVRTPRRVRALVHVLARSKTGNRQLYGRFPDLGAPTTTATMKSLVQASLHPVGLFDAAIYAGFVAAGRVRAHRSTARWERDESSRV